MKSLQGQLLIASSLLGDPNFAQTVILMVLHTDQEAADLRVIDGVYFSTEKDKVEQVLAAAGDESRFFVGYAGWSPGQLDREMETGSWLNTPSNRGWIFNDDDGQWSRL